MKRLPISAKRIISELNYDKCVLISELSLKNNVIKNLLSVLEGQAKQRQLMMEKICYLEDRLLGNHVKPTKKEKQNGTTR